MTSQPAPPSQPHQHVLRAPWVLIDDTTITQTVCLLERLARWLEDTPGTPTTACATALSLDETDDPISISSWADALAARLRHRAGEATLDLDTITD